MNKVYYKIFHLGCKVNLYECQCFKSQLDSLGYFDAGNDHTPSLCIVNTCSVTKQADLRSLHKIRTIIRMYPKSKIFVTGCLVSTASEQLESLSCNLVAVPNGDKEDIVKMIDGGISKEIPEFCVRKFSCNTRAFVKIQDGCNSFCSYCTIPFARGRSRSRNFGSIISEIEGLVENGHREIVLTGIDVGSFDGGDGRGLAHLIEYIDRIFKLKRIRISSIDPSDVNDRLIEVVAQGRATCHSMHMSLQSGSNKVLKRMNRRYCTDHFYKVSEKLKSISDDFTLTTDIIVGFPEESEDDFADTLKIVKDLGFIKVHVFPFSIREGTVAERMSGRVPLEKIKERKSKLIEFANEVSYNARDRYVGRSDEVLVEGRFEKCASGYTKNFIRVKIAEGNFKRNEILRVKFVKNCLDHLIGETYI